MKLLELLEALGPNVLYHYTGSGHNALSILQNNYFRLNAYFGSSYSKEDFDKRFYYLSATRSKVGDYHVRVPRGVMFVLDRDRIQNNLHIKPLDYWRMRNVGKSEAEDRIVSDNPQIENARKYILEVHVGIDMDKEFNISAHNVYYVKTYLLAKQLGIPAYFYNNMKDWQAQAKHRAVTPDVKAIFNQGREERLHRAKNPGITFSKSNWIEPWLELHYKNDRTELSSQAKRALDNIIYRWMPGEAVRQFSNDIQNDKRNPSNSLHNLIKVFKELGIRQPAEYIEHLQKKWAPKD